MKPNASKQTLSPSRPVIRCAIYTRKSTEEGLEQEFNSLDAQREAAESYIASQKHQGWICLPDRYDDGGFTGGNMQRPALKRLLADIQAGRIQAVLVYKVDRLSRSLLDFAKMMESFDQHQVAFVSVTQQFNTATSMGRLVLNVLLSFAQFEREIISERTRDKIAAARRRGKWSGGMPLLGYNVDPSTSKLVVHAEEAQRVQAIFALYLTKQSLRKVLEELARRRWLTKRWRTRKGWERGGRPFTKSSLHQLLSNVVYLGQVRYKQEVHAGEHAAIVAPDTWQQVQELLRSQDPARGSWQRTPSGALLRGLLHCACGAAMTPAHANSHSKRYQYYVCVRAQKQGRACCPARSLPAAKIERFVVEQLRHLGQEPSLWRDQLSQARQEERARLAQLETERLERQTQLVLLQADVRQLLSQIDQAKSNTLLVTRLATMQEELRSTEQRLTAIQEETIILGRGDVDAAEMEQAVTRFGASWQALAAAEQARLLRLVLQRVDYAADQENVSLTFHPEGIKTLATERTCSAKETNPCPSL